MDAEKAENLVRKCFGEVLTFVNHGADVEARASGYYLVIPVPKKKNIST